MGGSASESDSAPAAGGTAGAAAARGRAVLQKGFRMVMRAVCRSILRVVGSIAGRGDLQLAPLHQAHRYEWQHRRREQQRRVIGGRRRRCGIEEAAHPVRPQRGWSTRGELYAYHRMNGSLGVFFSMYAKD